MIEILHIWRREWPNQRELRQNEVPKCNQKTGLLQDPCRPRGRCREASLKSMTTQARSGSSTIYQERLEQFLAANAVPEDDESRRRAILLNSCGKATYHIIRNLVSPKRPSETAYRVICEKLRQHFNPRPTVTVQRYRFNIRVQQQEEDIATFVSKLRELSEHCDFKNTLDEQLRDRLVCGVSDERIKRRLLTDTDLTFQKAFDVARNMETAGQNLTMVQSNTSAVVTPTGMHQIRQEQTSRKTRLTTAAVECSRCGGINHTLAKCYFKNSECYNCQGRGHLARACRNKSSKQPTKQGRSKPPQQAKWVELGDTSDSNSDQGAEETFAIKRTTDKSKPIMVDLEVNGKKLQMELNAGASVSLISKQAYLTTWSDSVRPVLHPSSRKLQTYRGVNSIERRN